MTEARRILCVEDNLADFGLLHEAFQELALDHLLDHVVDGECALAYLRRQGNFAATPSPDLMLLDLNLPKKSGFEVLQELSLDPAFQQLQIVILTTTARELDVKRAAGGLHIHFVTKPMDFDAFVDIVRQIDWLARNVPRHG